MKPIGLIIEDNAEIRDALADRLESLGHDFDAVGSQVEARDRLKRCTFDYILLDLELPVRIGRPPSVACGKNILCEIRDDTKHAHVPVIVVTAHGHDSPDLAVEMMKLGATDYGIKPFHDLDQKIREVLAGKRSFRTHANREAPLDSEQEVLESAELTFFEDRVELAGIEICNKDSGVIWRVISILTRTWEDGRSRGFPAQMIANELGIDRGQNAVIDAVSNFRRRTVEIMAEGGMRVMKETVIVTGKTGYQLNTALTIRVRDSPPTSPSPDDDTLAGEERQQWILKELTQGRKLRRADVEKKFSKSSATVKRDLGSITDRIEFRGSGATGYYVLREVSSRKE